MPGVGISSITFGGGQRFTDCMSSEYADCSPSLVATSDCPRGLLCYSCGVLLVMELLVTSKSSRGHDWFSTRGVFPCT